MKIKKIDNKKLFYIVIFLALAVLIFGVILISLNISAHQEFISATIAKKEALPSQGFVYGVFLLVMGILGLILSAFIGNDVFNKKLGQSN
ncbi:hypothetical protein [Mesomycoplasma ovipneumoniae]|uniref:hypothetical protein n=1 Tax=Mesomycoplasma ovipneumoniae TaxID=29562 RepID=UPI00083E8B6D|nr:hypothetical protein [Mesomycoplasma ovipneumoniae]